MQNPTNGGAYTPTTSILCSSVAFEECFRQQHPVQGWRDKGHSPKSSRGCFLHHTELFGIWASRGQKGFWLPPALYARSRQPVLRIESRSAWLPQKAIIRIF